jgi:neutral ceramidase
MNSVFIAAGSVAITPRRPAALGGYERRTAPFKSIADPLEANVLRIEGDHQRAIIISTDLLYPGQTLRTLLLSSLALREEELFLCASHTHYAPMTAPQMPLLGTVDDQYVDQVAERISTLIRSLEKRRQPCAGTYHEGLLNHSMNRRLTHLRLTRSGFSRAVGMGPNVAGERDESARVLKFVDPSGRPLAIVWNYACHASDFFDPLRISAAFPGRVRKRLRSELGAVPVLFLQGFSGDVRPPFTGLSPDIKSLAKRILHGPQFKNAPSRQEWEGWSGSLADCVAAIARTSAAPLQIREPVSKRIEVCEKAYVVDGDGSKSLCWHLVDCGGFRIAGINAEPVVRYRRLLQYTLDGSPLLTAGCLDQTHCYLPIDEMLGQRGYEVEGFRRIFGFPGSFRAHLEIPIVQALSEAIA